MQALCRGAGYFKEDMPRINEWIRRYTIVFAVMYGSKIIVYRSVPDRGVVLHWHKKLDGGKAHECKGRSKQVFGIL